MHSFAFHVFIVIVDKTADFVARNGKEFETRIRAHEKDNPKFKFLLKENPYNAYYEMKIEESKVYIISLYLGKISPVYLVISFVFINAFITVRLLPVFLLSNTVHLPRNRRSNMNWNSTLAYSNGIVIVIDFTFNPPYLGCYTIISAVIKFSVGKKEVLSKQGQYS